MSNRQKQNIRGFWLVKLTSNVYSQQKKDRRKVAEIQRDLNFCPSISIRYLLYQPLDETQRLLFSRQRKNPKERIKHNSIVQPGVQFLSPKHVVEKILKPRENNGTERETPSLALGICQFHLSYF